MAETIKCCECGQFVAYSDIEAGLCAFKHEPDSHFGPEVNEWACPVCTNERLAELAADG